MDRDYTYSIPLLEYQMSNNGRTHSSSKDKSDDKPEVSDCMEMTGDIGANLGYAAMPLEDSMEKKYEYQSKEMKDFFALEWDKNCYFSDGKRQIDYVLAYEDDSINGSVNGETPPSEEIDADEDDDDRDSPTSPRSSSEKKRIRRFNYELNLQRMGLQIERVSISPTLGRTRFVLLHAPFAVLEKQAQLFSVKLPVRQSDVVFPDRTSLPGFVDSILSRVGIFDFDASVKKVLEEPDFFTAPYSSDRRQQFVNWDRPDILFPNAERSRMVFDLLTRAHYDSALTDRKRTSQYRFGIERLLAQGVYNAAYPLHQGIRERLPRGHELSQRELLYNHWVSYRNILKYQPLDCIKRYFGTKVAFYFAWLGYYTKSLYAAALLGILTVMFGIWNISEDVVSNDICGKDGVGANTIVCPQCENYCDFQLLNNSCLYAKMSYLFDNGVTVIFAALMSVWATFFLEGWKRYHAEIAWKWGLLDLVVEEDTVRPDFQFRVKTKRFNPVTQKEEPYLSGKKKVANFCAGGITVLFFMCLVLAVVFGMVVYRVICMRLLASMDNPTVDSYAFLIVSSTAASINLSIILCMNYFYNALAHRLTRWECPRTQADFDNSYTFKVFLFQFANYYSSLFYVAFFKGVLSQLPGTRDNDGNVKIAGYRLEGCDPAGCFVELVIQLAIIMCGKQFVSGLVEFAYPNFMKLLRRWQLMAPIIETKEQRMQRLCEETSKKTGRNMERWEADYYLNPTYDQFLFDEYLEMVLQFGFVTLFVAAFPLAPLFAVLNNIFEIRLDAYKFLLTIQKPVPAQAKNIGVWLNILDMISKFTVPINALVIAFTSDFIPRTMYFLANSSMIGYVNSSLSYFDATDFNMKSSQFSNVTQCRYRGFRRSPCSLMSERSTVYGPEACDDDLGYSMVWWKVLAARLLFVVIFEHVVFAIKLVIEYLIPDIPARIFVQQQREKYLVRKALLSELVSGRVPNGPTAEQKAAVTGDTSDTAFQPGSFEHDSPRKVSESSYTTAYQGRGSVQNLPESGRIE
ncbi:Anoctamin [Trichostrongylus colubriformis]|uniref:Anoctamin n=1 Tax=Trichostrongylus colubriformis TaxID=6319 RepID=A0AAN8FED4_TRICO